MTKAKTEEPKTKKTEPETDIELKAKTKVYKSWDEVFKDLEAGFPPKAYKKAPHRGGFTSLGPYYIIARLNTVFGPMGRGWGIDEIEFKPAILRPDKELMCHGVFWYRSPVEGDERNIGKIRVCGFGDTNEAEKKAETNLISKAASYLHIGIQLFQGEHQGSSYYDGTEQVAATKVASKDEQKKGKTPEGQGDEMTPMHLLGSLTKLLKDKNPEYMKLDSKQRFAVLAKMLLVKTGELADSTDVKRLTQIWKDLKAEPAKWIKKAEDTLALIEKEMEASK